MSNQPDADNRVLSVRISRELYRKLQKQASLLGKKFNEFLRMSLAGAADKVRLDDEDYKKIRREKADYIAREVASGRRAKDKTRRA